MSMETAVVKIEMTARLGNGESMGMFMPRRAHPGDAAFDLMNAEDEDAVIPPLGRRLFSAGFRMELPEGWEAQIRPRSGNAARKGITVLNAPGTVDSGYRGEVKVLLYNSDRDEAVTVRRGDRIAQMVVQRLPDVRLVFDEPLDGGSARGGAGFGSTGIIGQ